MSFVIKPQEVLRVIEGQSARYYAQGNVIFRVYAEHDTFAFESTLTDDVRHSRPGLNPTFERFVEAVDAEIEKMGIKVRAQQTSAPTEES